MAGLLLLISALLSDPSGLLWKHWLKWVPSMFSHWSPGTSGVKGGCTEFYADVAVLNQFTMHFQTGFFYF